ncbi:MAG: hypothetical protein HKN11_16055 [Rhizobiales bacterium]|nr:hypothetical protein [Hyphomicrobiales bacterium]
MGVKLSLGHSRAIAAIWGFAEATLFFIVPDVWLSFVALQKGLRDALWAVCFAVAGAIAGGAFIYAASIWNYEATISAIDAVPAISPGMISQVRSSLQQEPLWAMMVGSLTGVPYKVFASQAAANGIELTNFALATIPARAFRFVVVVALIVIIARLLLTKTSNRIRTGILASCWAVFYGFYFTLMPN